MAAREQQPHREGLRRYGKAALVIGGLAVGAAILL